MRNKYQIKDHSKRKNYLKLTYIESFIEAFDRLTPWSLSPSINLVDATFVSRTVFVSGCSISPVGVIVNPMKVIEFLSSLKNK